ncbi:MAG: hypothetical protein CMC70_02415 [Flavobacteriaceae bacterium]|nr:hypothetical protein [Flavobacteriaceae bacterium]
MKFIASFLFLLVSVSIPAQNSEMVTEIEAYQASENEKFANPETTILQKKDFRKFNGLDFYPINLEYRVVATFVRTPDELPFLMPTSTKRLPEYVKYGEAHFTIKGEALTLNLYQSTTPSEDPAYKDYLFVPFTDLTSGNGSYAGGRFLDTFIPKGMTLVLDFNKAYNPYCAYNPNYSCPIPPPENDLSVHIEAGVKDFGKH